MSEDGTGVGFREHRDTTQMDLRHGTAMPTRPPLPPRVPMVVPDDARGDMRDTTAIGPDELPPSAGSTEVRTFPTGPVDEPPLAAVETVEQHLEEVLVSVPQPDAIE